MRKAGVNWPFYSVSEFQTPSMYFLPFQFCFGWLHFLFVLGKVRLTTPDISSGGSKTEKRLFSVLIASDIKNMMELIHVPFWAVQVPR